MSHNSRLGKTIGEFFYFFGWGFFWGGWLGALAGTLIFPVAGTIFSVVWGLGLGIILGIVAALLAALLYPLQPAPKDVVFYRRDLVRGIGGVTAIGAPILLMLSSHGLLWGDYTDYAGAAFLPSMLAAFVFGGLAAANTASLYTHTYLGEPDPLAKFGDVTSTIAYFMARPTHLLWFGLFAAIYAGSLTPMIGQYGIADIFNQYFPAILTAAASNIVLTVLLSLVLGTLIGFLNRIYFVEYAAHWTLERYRAVMMVLVSMFIFAMLLAWAFTWLIVVKDFMLVIAPLILLYSVWLARGYAERYYEMQGKPKRKGKPKNEGALELRQEIT
jgi:hypothetical protein